MDNSGPVEVEDRGGVFPKDGLFTTATFVHFRACYANGVELICKTNNKHGAGVRFVGTEGWAEYGYGKFGVYPRSLLNLKLKPNDIHLYRSKNHFRNFIDCIKTRQEPAAPVEVGHRSSTVCHLGNIAMKLHRKLQWDPVREQFINDEQANRMLCKPLRGGWHL